MRSRRAACSAGTEQDRAVDRASLPATCQSMPARGGRRGGVPRVSGRSSAAVRDRQSDREDRAAARSGVHGRGAAVTLGGRQRDREPQAGARVAAIGRVRGPVEPFEDAGSSSAGMPMPWSVTSRTAVVLVAPAHGDLPRGRAELHGVVEHVVAHARNRPRSPTTRTGSVFRTMVMPRWRAIGSWATHRLDDDLVEAHRREGEDEGHVQLGEVEQVVDQVAHRPRPSYDDLQLGVARDSSPGPRAGARRTPG